MRAHFTTCPKRPPDSSNPGSSHSHHRRRSPKVKRGRQLGPRTSLVPPALETAAGIGSNRTTGYELRTVLTHYVLGRRGPGIPGDERSHQGSRGTSHPRRAAKVFTKRAIYHPGNSQITVRRSQEGTATSKGEFHPRRRRQYGRRIAVADSGCCILPDGEGVVGLANPLGGRLGAFHNSRTAGNL